MKTSFGLTFMDLLSVVNAKIIHQVKDLPGALSLKAQALIEALEGKV